MSVKISPTFHKAIRPRLAWIVPSMPPCGDNLCRPMQGLRPHPTPAVFAGTIARVHRVCVEHPDLAIYKLLEAMDRGSLFFASFIGRPLSVPPSYILLPAIGLGVSGVSDLVSRRIFALVSAVVGARGSVGTWLGWRPWPGQLDDGRASALKPRPLLGKQLAFEAGH